MSESSPKHSMETDSSSGKLPLEGVEYCLMWQNHVKIQTPKKTAKSEVDNYLEEERISLDDVKSGLLAWWKINSGQFPILSMIARDILAVPISTVPSESAFSVGGKLISPHRSRLKPSTVEALMCLQSWRGVMFEGKSLIICLFVISFKSFVLSF